MASARRRLSGHLRTVGHLAAGLLRPPAPPPSERWRTSLEDPRSGRVAVTGWLAPAGGDCLVILVHGLGGAADSPYLVRAARVARRLGLDSLRLNLRGADASAGDFYHGGLTAELHAAVAAPRFAGYRRIGVLGYSMGGHVAIRFAAEVEEPRLEAVAAICSPLDLATVADEFDRLGRRAYRWWVLRHLRRCLGEIERRGDGLPVPFAELVGARGFREWDALTVVPRFGFADPDDYYRRASAAAVVDRLRVPCLLVASPIDPVVPPRAIEPFLPAHAVVLEEGGAPRPLPPRPGAPGAAPLTVLWHRDGGHVAFPSAAAIEPRVLGWLTAPAAAAAAASGAGGGGVG